MTDREAVVQALGWRGWALVTLGATASAVLMIGLLPYGLIVGNLSLTLLGALALALAPIPSFLALASWWELLFSKQLQAPRWLIKLIDTLVAAIDVQLLPRKPRR